MNTKHLAFLMAAMMVAASTVVLIPFGQFDDGRFGAGPVQSGSIEGSDLDDLAEQGWIVIDSGNFMEITQNIGSKYPNDGRYILAEDIDLTGKPRLDGVFQIDIKAVTDGTRTKVSLYDTATKEQIEILGGVMSANSTVEGFERYAADPAPATIDTDAKGSIQVMAGGTITSPAWLAGKVFAVESTVTVDGGTATVYSGGNFKPIGSYSIRFEGTFDGNNRIIRGMETSSYTRAESFAYSAMFGVVTDATIRNLSLEGGRSIAAMDIGTPYAAGIVADGLSYHFTMTNCRNGNAVFAVGDSTAMAGGLVCRSHLFRGTTVMKDCINTGDITAASRTFSTAGGVIGRSTAPVNIIEDCTNIGNIRAWNGSNADAAGIATIESGDMTEIRGCVNIGDIKVTATMSGISKGYGTGIANVGSANANISQCTNLGNITVESVNTTSASGISGYGGGSHDDSVLNITGCVNEGDVTGLMTMKGSGTMCVGGIHATIQSTRGSITIKDCTNSGDITGESFSTVYIGGMIGHSNCRTDVIGCSNSSGITIKGHRYSSANASAGGIAGTLNKGGIISGCSNDGDVAVSMENGTAVAGGIAGTLSGDADVEMCRSDCSITSHSDNSDSHAGGIVGVTSGSGMTAAVDISDCYSRSSVGSSSDATNTYGAYAGGIAGSSFNFTDISNSYSTGKIVCSGSAAKKYAGGAVGFGTAQTNISHAYFETSDDIVISNGVFTVTPSDDTGKRTAGQLKDRNAQNNFIGWDFGDVWAWDEQYNDAYPILRASFRAHSFDAAGVEGDAVTLYAYVSIPATAYRWQSSDDGAAWIDVGTGSSIQVSVQAQNMLYRCIVDWNGLTAECDATVRSMAMVTMAYDSAGPVYVTYDAAGIAHPNVSHVAGDAFLMDRGSGMSCTYEGESADSLYWTNSQNGNMVTAETNGTYTASADADMMLRVTIADTQVILPNDGKVLATYTVGETQFTKTGNMYVPPETDVTFTYKGDDHITYWNFRTLSSEYIGKGDFTRTVNGWANVSYVSGNIHVTVADGIVASVEPYNVGFNPGTEFYVNPDLDVRYTYVGSDNVAYWTLNAIPEYVSGDSTYLHITENTHVATVAGDVEVYAPGQIDSYYNAGTGENERRLYVYDETFYVESGTEVTFEHPRYWDVAYWRITHGGADDYDVPGDMVRELTMNTEVACFVGNYRVTLSDGIDASYDIDGHRFDPESKTFYVLPDTDITFGYSGDRNAAYWLFDGIPELSINGPTMTPEANMRVSVVESDITVNAANDVKATFNIGTGVNIKEVSVDGKMFSVMPNTAVTFEYTGTDNIAYWTYDHGTVENVRAGDFTKKVSESTKVAYTIGTILVSLEDDIESSYIIEDRTFKPGSTFYVVPETDVTFRYTGSKGMAYWTFTHGGSPEYITDAMFHRSIEGDAHVAMVEGKVEVTLSAGAQADYKIMGMEVENSGLFYVVSGTEVTFSSMKGPVGYWTVVHGGTIENVSGQSFTMELMGRTMVSMYSAPITVTLPDDGSVRAAYVLNGQYFTSVTAFHVTPDTEVTFRYLGKENLAYWTFATADGVEYDGSAGTVRAVGSDTDVSYEKGDIHVTTESNIKASYDIHGKAFEPGTDFYVPSGTDVTFTYTGRGVPAYWEFNDIPEYVSGNPMKTMDNGTHVAAIVGNASVTTHGDVRTSYKAGFGQYAKTITVDDNLFYVPSGSELTFSHTGDGDLAYWTIRQGKNTESVTDTEPYRTVSSEIDVSYAIGDVKVTAGLGIAASYDAAGTIMTISGTFRVPSGTEVTFKCDKVAYWTFIHGGDMEYITDATLIRTLTMDTEVTARTGDVEVKMPAGGYVNASYEIDGIHMESTVTFRTSAGTEVRFTASDQSGLKFDHWVFSDSKGAVNDNPYTRAVNDDVSVDAEYVDDDGGRMYCVTIGKMENGNIEWKHADDSSSRQDPFWVAAGTEVTFKAVPDDGYVFTRWNDGTVINPYTVKVEGDMTIYAEFAAMKFTITATADDNSAIDPSGTVSVDAGGEVTFTFSVKDGYEIKVMIDGKEMPELKDKGEYTFTDVNGDHTIEIVSSTGAGPGPGPDDGDGNGDRSGGSDIGLLEIIIATTAAEVLLISLLAYFVRAKRGRRDDAEEEN